MSVPSLSDRSKEVRVLDCTIRDGGLVNNHLFSDEFVRAVYETCLAAGIEYMEMGYKDSRQVFDPKKNGPWRYCDEEDLRRIVGDNPTELKLAAMVNTSGKPDWKTLVGPKKQSVLDTIRVAFNIGETAEAIEAIHHAKEMGYEVTANPMATSTVDPQTLEKTLERVVASPADMIVVVDSYGALYVDDVARLVEMYLDYGRRSGKRVGIHAHNNQQLALANTIRAYQCGATLLDVTVAGLGRGAGNCPIELLLGYLRQPRYSIRPIYQLIQEEFPTLRRQISPWGALPQYNITGQLNQNPKAAIAHLDGDRADRVADFYDEMVTGIAVPPPPKLASLSKLQGTPTGARNR